MMISKRGSEFPKPQSKPVSIDEDQCPGAIPESRFSTFSQILSLIIAGRCLDAGRIKVVNDVFCFGAKQTCFFLMLAFFVFFDG